MHTTGQSTIQNDERTERPRSLPLSHQLTVFETNQWIRWLNQHLHDDKNGRYAAFSLSTSYSVESIRKRFEARCPDETFIFLLPSVSAGGNEHFHGLVRIPERATTDLRSWVPVLISEDNSDLGIYVPQPIKSIFWNPRSTQLESNLGDIHFSSDGERIKLFTYRNGNAQGVFRYWKKRRDGEIRHFGEGEFIPHRNRTAIRVRTGRDPQPRRVAIK
jgi:hypothetical protein